MGNRGGVTGKRSQLDYLAETKRREACDNLSAMSPMGAFTDSLEADSFDKNGKVVKNANTDLPTGGLDLGRFPPNE